MLVVGFAQGLVEESGRDAGGCGLGLAVWLKDHRSDWELEGLDGIQQVAATMIEQLEQTPEESLEEGNPGQDSKEDSAEHRPEPG